jgi:hypothetical protein
MLGQPQQGINFGLVNGNNDLVGIVKNGSSGIQSFFANTQFFLY